jgi:hypothetical protein
MPEKKDFEVFIFNQKKPKTNTKKKTLANNFEKSDKDFRSDDLNPKKLENKGDSLEDDLENPKEKENKLPVYNIKKRRSEGLESVEKRPKLADPKPDEKKGVAALTGLSSLWKRNKSSVSQDVSQETEETAQLPKLPQKFKDQRRFDMIFNK